MFADDAHHATLADDSKAHKNARIAAVWAHAHDLALDRHGEENVNSFFTAPKGDALMAELQAMPADAPVSAMLEAVEKHLGPGKDKADARRGEPHEDAPAHD